MAGAAAWTASTAATIFPVSAAATDIARHALANFLFGENGWISAGGTYITEHPGFELLEHGFAGTDLPGRAEAALGTILFDKGGLQRMQLLTVGEQRNAHRAGGHSDDTAAGLGHR